MPDEFPILNEVFGVEGNPPTDRPQHWITMAPEKEAKWGISPIQPALVSYLEFVRQIEAMTPGLTGIPASLLDETGSQSNYSGNRRSK